MAFLPTCLQGGPLHRPRMTVSTKVEQMCVSHSAIRSEACSVRRRGGGLAGKRPQQERSGDGDQTNKELLQSPEETLGWEKALHRNTGVGPRLLMGEVHGDWRHSELIEDHGKA